MYKTIEAIYDNGLLKPLNEPLNIKNGKVFIIWNTDVYNKVNISKEDAIEEKRISLIKETSGICKGMIIDPVEWQRKIRDDWEERF